MLYDLNCPKCGEEQKNLDLEETEGSFICSKCGEQVKVNLEDLHRMSVTDIKEQCK